MPAKNFIGYWIVNMYIMWSILILIRTVACKRMHKFGPVCDDSAYASSHYVVLFLQAAVSPIFLNNIRVQIHQLQ